MSDGAHAYTTMVCPLCWTPFYVDRAYVADLVLRCDAGHEMTRQMFEWRLRGNMPELNLDSPVPLKARPPRLRRVDSG